MNEIMRSFIRIIFILHITHASDSGSLWGKKVVLEHTSCQSWFLSSDQWVPSLDHLSVCMNIKRSINSSVWSAFSYLHPNRTHVELGFGGRLLHLQVRLFGRSWVTPDTLTLGVWHYVCITWSCSANQLSLFINGRMAELSADPDEAVDPGREGGPCTLAGGGSLTLGAKHYYAGESMVVESGTNLQGSVTLFRVWSRARGPTEIYNNTCTDGDAIMWHGRVWNTEPHCPPVEDSTLKCAWSLYEVRVRLLIHSSKNISTTYEAREIAHIWLRAVLPYNIYIPKVVASTITSSFDESSMINFLQDERVRDSPSVSRFDILAHLNVIPGEDVSKIQNEVFNLLKEKFNYSDHYLITDKDFLLVYPTDEDTTVVVPHSTPQTTTTMTSFTSTSTSPVTDSRSTEATDTTAVVPHSTPETTTTVTSFTSASTSSSPPTDSPSTEATGATDTTAVVPHSTPETTTLVTSFTSTSFTSTSTSPLTDSPSTEATGTTAVVSHSTPQTTTLRTSFTSTSFTSTSPLPSTEATDTTAVVPHSTPQTTIMVTNFTSTSTSTSPLTDSPSTEATGTTGTTVVVPHSTPQTTTTMTNFTSTSLTSTSPVTPSTEATESFFKVTANVTISGLEQDPLTTVQTWLHETFSRDEIQVLNIRITSQLTKGQSLEKSSYDLRAHFVTSARRLMCEFQVMVPSCSNVNETQNQIRHLLELPYRNGSVELLTLPDQVHIFLIEPGFCPSHIHQTRRGLYVWRQTSAQKQRRRPCQGDPAHAASRQCLLSATTNRAVWTPPDLHDCPTVVNTLSDLEQITVTNDTAVDVLEMIVDMMQESERLDERELWIVLNTLEAVLNVSAVTPDLAQVIVNITSDILTSQSDLQPFTNNILKITETVGDELSGFSGASVSMVAPALALSVVNVDPDHFYNLTFGAAVNNNPHPEVYINQDPAEGTVAFVTLPESIHTSFPQHSSPRVQFQFYGVPELFQDDQTDKVLNTYVVSASVINAVQPIKDLKVPVIVTLHHLNTPLRGRDVQCVYWNFNKNGGRGGWSPSGCWRYSVTDEYTTCMCDHLTHFGVLLDVSRTPIDAKHERILTLITYTGCGVSSFFLGVTVLTYTLLEKLRRDYPSQILLNLSIALLGLNLVFLVNSWLSSFGLAALCVAVATTQHYFLLASFIWMFLEAVNMYFALVKVFNSYVPSFILKLCTVGWGVPLLICCLVLVVKPDSYGLLMLQNSEKFCWVSDDVVFYVCVVGVVGVVLLVNGSVFLVVLVQVRRACVSERSGLMKELRGVTSLTLLLGLTWSAAFFTWGSAKVPLLYLFSILNSLQGFLIFVFQCLMKENVRKQWRLHLCFGCFKLQDYSEWSHTPPLGPKLKLTPVFRFPTVASFRSDKSSSTQSSSASSQSSQRQSSSPKRPDLGVVYQQGFLFPRAHAALPKSTEYDPQPLNWIPKEAPSADIYY